MTKSRSSDPRWASLFLRPALLAAALTLSCNPAGPSPVPPNVSMPGTSPAVSPSGDRFDWPDAVVYFVVTDRFADGDLSHDPNVDRSAKGAFHGGDLAGLTRQLPEIASLGVNAVWITPVVRNIPGFVTGAGFPDWAYHGYWADDFESLDPRFGTEAELRGFVEACHARGIRVLLDVVYNHAGYGSRYLSDPRTKDWFRSTEKGDCGDDDLTTCVGGLPDFKTERPEVADFLLKAQIGWAKRLGVDGFRLDTVKHVSHEFWKEHRARTRRELGKEFFLLGEVWGGDPQVLDPWFEGDELDAGLDFAFQGNVVSWVKGRGRTVAFDRYLGSREKTRPGYHLAHYLSSHDTPGALWQLDGDVALFRLAEVLQLTTLGIPVVYYGEEVARAGGDWPDNRSDMPWGARDVLPGKGLPRDERLRADTAKLIAIRRAHRALSRGAHVPVQAEGDLLVFRREDAASGDSVVVAVNRGSSPAVARFARPASWGGSARDLFDGRPLASGGNAAASGNGSENEIAAMVGPRSFLLAGR